MDRLISGYKQEIHNSECIQNKNYAKSMIFQSSIAATFRDCAIASIIQELIPLVFPLKIIKSRPENTPLIPLLKEGEMSWLLPPFFIREGRGGISFWSFAMVCPSYKRWITSHLVTYQWYNPSRTLNRGLGRGQFCTFSMVFTYELYVFYRYLITTKPIVSDM
jgi:hypothetical protein